tara:strand:+ start:795 stop:1109 length:315 start_codon:yes stop_codon:yes gene_type:complete
MKNFFYGFLLITLIILTTLIKNSTKNIDKKIFQSKENIRMLRDRYELVLLDYNYLSSPKKLSEYQEKYFDEHLVPIDIGKISKIHFETDLIIIEKFVETDEKQK